MIRTQGKYTAREQTWEELEGEGEISFRYMANDGRPEHSVWLVGLKNVFSKQLPNMPKEYISRLVFDRRHRWGRRVCWWTDGWVWWWGWVGKGPL